MDEASKQALLSALRSVLIAIGAIVSTKGYADGETVNAVVGLLMAAVAAAWGAYEGQNKEKKTLAREAVAVNVGIAVADRTVGVTPAVPSANVPAVIEAFAPVATEAPNATGTGLAISPTSPVLSAPPK